MAEYSLFWSGTSQGDAAQATYGAPYSDDTLAKFFQTVLTPDPSTWGVLLNNYLYDGHFAASRSGTTLTIGNGAAVVLGALYWNTGSTNFTLTTDGWYQAVLRKDNAAQTVRLVIRAGNSVTQFEGSTWEIELWRFYWISGTSELRYFDNRRFLSLASGMVKIGEDVVGIDRGTEGDGQLSVTSILSGAGIIRAYKVIADSLKGTDDASGSNYQRMFLVLNGDRSASAYGGSLHYSDGISTDGVERNAGDDTALHVGYCGVNGTDYNKGNVEITIYNPERDLTQYVSCSFHGFAAASSTTERRHFVGGGEYNAVTYISTIALVSENAAGTFETGRMMVYALF